MRSVPHHVCRLPFDVHLLHLMSDCVLQVMDLVSQYNVSLYLNGHDHTASHADPNHAGEQRLNKVCLLACPKRHLKRRRGCWQCNSFGQRQWGLHILRQPPKHPILHPGQWRHHSVRRWCHPRVPQGIQQLHRCHVRPLLRCACQHWLVALYTCYVSSVGSTPDVWELQAHAVTNLLVCCSYNINDEGSPGEGFAIITATPCNITVRMYTCHKKCSRPSLCPVKYLLPVALGLT